MLGRSLGNYGVVSKSGEGGMRVVYLARHATLGRKAAVKVLRPEMSSNPETVSRFFNEARAATAVKHPGNRTAYIIMEHLEGESLATRLRRCRPAIAVTLTIVRAIARALQAAHEQHIVHRDLKPDNVFLVPDPELPSGERVKILDFGIAKLARRVGEANHTQTGTVMGTPTYMSPEQCTGTGVVDHRADLYSLGCVAYEMLCGQPPFAANDPGMLLARHLCMEPVPPTSHRPDLPAEVEDIVLRLLKKAPRERYSNAAELVRAIDQLSAMMPADAYGKPLPTEQVATLPLVKERTTLNGAASSREVPRIKDSSWSLVLLAAGATFVIAVLVIILFLTRSSHDGEIASNPTRAPLPTDQGGSATVVRPASPVTTTTPPGPAGPAPVPSTNARPDQQLPVGAAQTGGPGAATEPPSSATQPATAPLEVRKPAEPTGPAPVKPSGDETTPSVPDRPSAPSAATSDDVARPRETAAPPVAQKAHPPKPSAAARAKPASGRAEASNQTDASESIGLEKRTKTPKPAGAAGTDEPTPSIAAKPSAAPNAGDVAATDAARVPADATSRGSESASAGAEPPAPCTRAAFTAVLAAKVTSKKELENAWARLNECKPKMSPELYRDIQRGLILKQS
ncbi:MAG: hypothetical protein E6J90_16715 [Deltaproteobacteria bacterium]|nr:MAG: hypothetical protein E6J90_16715 [Deltaproteobacteria bacterium]